MKLTVKKHINHCGQLVLAVCDAELLGKRFEEGRLQLDLSSDYYRGECVHEQVAVPLFKKAYMLCLVGKECIALAVQHQLVKREDVKQIAGVACVNMIQMSE